MRVLVTGGCGYVGSVLVPMLQAIGYAVNVLDIGWFGGHVLSGWKMDISEISVDFCGEFDAIIHLAAVANDPSALLDTELTWKTNAFGTMNLAEKAAAAGVKQFIYASSGSVYGLSDAPCTEESPCVPLSAYNETKKVAERALLSYADRMAVQIVRPATVCGYSPRQRLDVLVNELTASAYRSGEIHLRAPEAMRPHIHIQDMCRLYLRLLERRNLTGIWNAGFENRSVREVAQIVENHYAVKVTEEAQSNDRRSYWMDSSKLLAAGFEPKHSVGDAVREVLSALVDGRIVDEDRCYNVKWMRDHVAV